MTHAKILYRPTCPFFWVYQHLLKVKFLQTPHTYCDTEGKVGGKRKSSLRIMLRLTDQFTLTSFEKSAGSLGANTQREQRLTLKAEKEWPTLDRGSDAATPEGSPGCCREGLKAFKYSSVWAMA